MSKRTDNRRKSARKFAPLGLWLAGLAFLAGIIFLAIKLLVLMQIYVPADGTWINTALLIVLGVFILGLATFALLNPRKVRELITGRQAKHGSNALITLAALFGIIIVVNLLIYKNPVQWDWTEDKQHTLAPETLSTLQALTSPVQAIGFFTQNSNSSTASDLMTDFKDNSNGMFDFQFIDPDQNPALAQQYGITRDGSIVLVLEDRQEVLTYASEQNITSALVRLMNPGERVVYFITGHGESDLQNSGDTAFTRVSSVLKSKNYTVRSLNLRAENEIPTDALALVIAGRTKPYTAGEVALLKAYVDGGGSLVLLEQTTLETEVGSSPDPLLNYLSAAWGVVFNNDIVIDPSSDPLSFAVSDSYGSHAITENIQNTITFFPISRSITLTSTDAAITQTPLIITVDSAWGETDFDSLSNGDFQYQADSDFSGPILLAAVLENTTTGGQLAVIGDGSFATDTFFDQYGNADLFINTVDWAAGEQDMISLTAKDTTERTLKPIQNFGWIVLGLSFICIIPGIIIAGGIISWITRRAKG
jgi:ABC-type uncharacterized transport system involved in gliding motility auxiliary subunit